MSDRRASDYVVREISLDGTVRRLTTLLHSPMTAIPVVADEEMTELLRTEEVYSQLERLVGADLAIKVQAFIVSPAPWFMETTGVIKSKQTRTEIHTFFATHLKDIFRTETSEECIEITIHDDIVRRRKGIYANNGSNMSVA